jgi:alcohol dehydrogenase
MLFKTVQSKKIEPKKLITHRFKLDQMIAAYDTFEHASREKALKVLLEN